MKFLIGIALMISIVAARESTENSVSQDFQAIIKVQLSKYPEIEIQDLYKLTFQAAMGSAHMGLDSVKAFNYLNYELQQIEADSSEPLIEEIAPQGKVVRINLRPFKAIKGNKEKLTSAFIQTANKFKSSIKNLENYWQALIIMVKKNQIPFNAHDLQTFFNEMRKQSFPAVHHSEKYKERYKPAYRVIAKEFLPVLKLDY